MLTVTSEQNHVHVYSSSLSQVNLVGSHPLDFTACALSPHTPV